MEKKRKTRSKTKKINYSKEDKVFRKYYKKYFSGLIWWHIFSIFIFNGNDICCYTVREIK